MYLTVINIHLIPRAGVVENDIVYIDEGVRRAIPFGRPCNGNAKLLCCAGNPDVPYAPAPKDGPKINPDYEW